MKKNVMVILCDQLRPDFLSCYNDNSPVNTPNIDNLALEGTLFQKAVTASPVCAPARASMMTGRYVSDHKVWTNDIPFREGMEYLPQRMKKNGYVCGAFGKLHHFPGKDTKGFDIAWQMEENRLKEDDDYFNYLQSKHSEVTRIFNIDKNGMFAYSPEEYYESQIAKNALDFIQENKGEKPFFAWVSFQGPHTPMDPPEFDYEVEEVLEPVNPDFVPHSEVTEYRRSRETSMTPEQVARYRLDYCKMIEFIDYKIGEMVKYLKDNNLYKETVIIFSTDHGDLCGDYGMFSKGPYIFSAQLEVPFIVTNHPELPKGVKTDMLTGNLDIGTTVLKIAKDDKPLGYSRDVATMWNNPELQRESVYTEFCDSVRILSNKEYRFAYYPFAKECELVLIEDETTNLADNPKYASVKDNFYKDIIDYMIISQGVKIEAHDLTPKVQEGLKKKLPDYQDIIPLAIPIPSKLHIERLKSDKLDYKYNEFCKTKPIINHYGKYWEEK